MEESEECLVCKETDHLRQDEETLFQIRKEVFFKVQHSVLSGEDIWMHQVKNLLPLYLQFHILDKLDEIIANTERN